MWALPEFLCTYQSLYGPGGVGAGGVVGVAAGGIVGVGAGGVVGVGSGVGVAAGPVLTVKVTVLPGFSGVCAGGSVEMTYSGAILSLASYFVTVHRRFTLGSARALQAASTFMLVTSGTRTVPGPWLTVSVIVVLYLTRWPLGTFWSMTCPAGLSLAT